MPDWKIAPTQLITTNAIALLKTVFGASARVYDSSVPVDAVYPYWMVLQIPGGSVSGPPLTNPEGDVQIVLQVDAVSNRRDAAQMAADRATEAMIGRNPSGTFLYALSMPSGWALCGRMRPDGEGPGGVEQEGAPPSSVYTVSNRFIIAVTPTA